MAEPISVVVLTYNSGRTLEACLASLAAQTVLPAEVIIVDDASTDDTLRCVERVASGFPAPIRVRANGSHNISRGRNIGMEASRSSIVAFLDSDAYADPTWIAALSEAFAACDEPAVVGGAVVGAHATPFAEALAMNDTVVRDLFARGTLLVSGCNMSVHLERIGGARFDEAFVHAEDIEFVHRACRGRRWAVAAAAVVHHESRTSPLRYLVQMYRYGAWKVRYSLRTRDFRAVDFVPTMVLLASLAALPLTLWALVALPSLCLAEAGFVVAYRRPAPRLLGGVILGWTVKNLGWGVGILRGLVGAPPLRVASTPAAV